MACYMLDFSVYKPPAEYKVNHTTGGENAKRWSVSSAAPGSTIKAAARLGARLGPQMDALQSKVPESPVVQP